MLDVRCWMLARTLREAHPQPTSKIQHPKSVF
jgi:hypothetical protein